MAINYELLNKGGISLGTNFELLSEKPLDSRLVVPSLDGLQNYIDNAAAYEGLIAYVSSEKKHYEVKVIDGVLSYRPFGLTEAELNDLITNATTAAMEFKGATATLPENPAKGDMYKVAGENINIKIDDVDAKLGDSIVYDGEKWFLIPSGDDIEDTWRPVAGVANDATLTFEAGDKLDVAVSSTGNIKYSHETVAAPELLAENEQTRTYITAVETDGYGHITGYKTATENVEDTNTEYTFESQVGSSSVYFNVTPNTEGAAEETIYVDAYSKNEADGKFVAKETGKSLVSDDEIARLAEVDNYDDEEVRGLIGDNAKAIEDLEKYVGTIPSDEAYKDIADVIGYVNKKAEETLAAASGNSTETAASVKQQLDNYKSENNTRVKAIEDDVAAIKDAETGILKQAQDYADGLAGNYDENGAAAGVKSELEVEIAKKVDKVEGKSLIDDSEIARLATLANYDDTQVKADIAKKADAEAMTTELGKKVDKADGKDLIATSEIERLATLKNYDDTALAGRVTTAEGKISALETEAAKHATKDELASVDAKFAGYNTTVAQKAIDDAQDARIKAIEDDYVVTNDIANFETKDNVKKVADDLAAETKARTDADAGFETRIAALEGNFGDGEGTVEAQIEAAVNAEKERAEGIEGGLRTDVNAVAGRMDTAEGKITDLEGASATHAVKTEVEGALALKADKSVVDAMYTNTQIDTAVQGAKDYAKGLVDAIPAQTDYTVTCADADFEATTDAPAFKRHTLTQNGATICTIDIPKELVVEAGSVKAVTEEDKPYAGAEIGDKYIELVIANQEEPIYVPAKDLVDIYTAKDNAAEVQIAISNTNEVSATLVNGGITEEKLAEGVKTKLNKTWEEVGVAKGLVDALAETHATDKEALEKAITDGDAATLASAKEDATSKANTAEANAKAYADGLAGNYAEADHDHVVADITDFESAVATKVESYGYATTGYADGKAADAQAAAEATAAGALATARTEISAEIDADVKALADGQVKTNTEAIATKANTADVYAKTETFTKDEVNAAIAAAVEAAHQWGEF